MTKLFRTIFFLSLIFYFSIANSQPYIGVFAGLNASNFSGDAPRYVSYKGLMGANVGAYLDLKLSKAVYMSIQPSYTQEGTKVSYSLSSKEKPVDSITLRLNYFSLPLFLKVASTNNRFYALGGLEMGLVLNSDASSHDVKEDIKADVSDFNIAMHFGAGIKIPVGFPRLFIELRYTQGLVNLTDDANEDNVIPRVKTSGFKIFAGIEIPLKKINK